MRYFRRILLWGVAPLFVILFAGLTSLYALCLYKPELIAAIAQRELSRATGMPWRIKGDIRPVFVPVPGLALSDVSLVAATREQRQYADAARPLVHVAKLRLYVDPAALTRLELRLYQVELVEPVINLTYDQYDRPLWRPLPDAVPDPGPGSGEPAAGDFAGDNGEALRRAAGILCALPSQAMQPVRIRNGSIMSYAADGSLLLAFTGMDGTFAPGALEDNLRLSTAFSLPDAGLALSVSLAGRLGCDDIFSGEPGCEGIPARGTLSGRVDMTPPGSRTLSGAFESGLIWLSDGRHIRLPDFRLTAEGDAVSGDLIIDLAEAQCRGPVLVHRLSLPRWFEFGRVLPPGLAEALHSVQGEFDLYFDKHKVEARKLRATAGALPVSGTVGAPDFSAPVVVVDLDLDEADLDQLFPFLAVAGAVIPEPEAPAFDHPSLVPYPAAPHVSHVPASPDAFSDFTVGYDVTVRVARPRVHAVNGGPLTVRVFPAVADGAEKVRVAFNAPSLLNGSLDGRLDIDSRAILMRYDAKDMELSLLPENVGSDVTVAGRVSGICEIDMPLLQGGSLADDWKIRIHAAISGCEIAGSQAGAPWRISGNTVTAQGEGGIFAARDKGLSITGVWNIAAAGIRTPWSSGGSGGGSGTGNDAIQGVFAGGLHWPPMGELPGTGVPGDPDGEPSLEKRGVDRVAGNLDLTGSLIVPLGSALGPIEGKLQADLDWRLNEETIALQNIAYEGFGSYVEGSAAIDFSGREVRFESEVNGKINPGEVLKGWGALTSAAGTIHPPQLLTGRTAISGRGGRSLRFDPIRVELDGSPVSGEISWQATPQTGGQPGNNSSSAEAGSWVVRLSASRLNLDSYFPPAPARAPGERRPPPSTTPWDLSFLKGRGLDAQLTLGSVRKDGLTFGRGKVTAVLQQDRFSFSAESAAFYNGTATLVLQGAVAPESSQVILRRGLVQVENADLGRILYDFSQDTSVGGTTSLLAEATGTLRRDADIPAALSGIWNLRIADGLYPTFGGGADSTLRNTFSAASASGALDKGVLRSRNFTLTGPMVDMSGSGWFNLTNREYDLEVSATFAKVPTVPVRFYGSIYEPRMRVRGMDMVMETVQHAGSTVFSLLRGILMLPAHALSGMSGAEERLQPARTAPVRTAPLAPLRQRTGNPGQ